VGRRVLAPLGERKTAGFILRILDQLPTDEPRELKKLMEIDEIPPFFTPSMVPFFEWISSHYLAPVGEVIKAALPPGAAQPLERFVSLTEEGRQANEARDLGCRALRLLEEIGRRGEVPWRELSPSQRRLLPSLKERGLIRVEERPRGRPLRLRKKLFLRLSPSSPEVKVSEKEREILSILEREGELPLEVLRKGQRRASDIVRRLMEKGVIMGEWREVTRHVIPCQGPKETSGEPGTPRGKILEAVRRGLKGEASPFLLVAPRGDGRDEIYVEACRMALEEGRSTIVLVPEISQATSLLERLCKGLGGEVALLHSDLTRTERYDQWRRIMNGEIRVVVGTRSALFAPVRSLGFIIVDEEHDPSYKEEGAARYNARDMATVRARLEGGAVVLCSATPSVESYYNARGGKFRLLEIEGGSPLKRVEVVDMRGRREILSPRLRHALRRAFSRRERALLLVRRRGFSPSTVCKECGEILRCPSCRVALTLHAERAAFICHCCGLRVPAPQICPSCGGKDLISLGFGTERVAEEVQALLPHARVSRMDSDIITNRRGYEELLKALKGGEIDVLVGTQMAVKEAILSELSFVGVVCADMDMNFPDFRAAERAFQLLAQLAWHQGGGRVMIQTFSPRHYVIEGIRRGDFSYFFKREVAIRKELHYPPFYRLVRIRLRGRDEERVRRRGEEMVAQLRQAGLEPLGPSPTGFRKGEACWQILVRGKRYADLLPPLGELLRRRQRGGVKMEVDVDPLSVL